MALLAPSHNKSSSSSTYRRSSLNIPPSGRRKRVIGPYPNLDSPLYLLKVKSLLGPMPGMCLASLPSLKASLYSDCEWINLLKIFGRCCWWNLQGQGFSSFVHIPLLHHFHVDSSSNFLFLRPAGVLRANNVFLLDSFWDLNVWKFGRENGVVVVSQRPLENDLTPDSGQNLKWMRTEWTWTQCIHVWCFGWHGSWIGTKMMYCLCGPPNTSVLNTQIETRSDYRET